MADLAPGVRSVVLLIAVVHAVPEGGRVLVPLGAVHDLHEENLLVGGNHLAVEHLHEEGEVHHQDIGGPHHVAALIDDADHHQDAAHHLNIGHHHAGRNKVSLNVQLA